MFLKSFIDCISTRIVILQFETQTTFQRVILPVARKLQNKSIYLSTLLLVKTSIIYSSINKSQKHKLIYVFRFQSFQTTLLSSNIVPIAE